MSLYRKINLLSGSQENSYVSENPFVCRMNAQFLKSKAIYSNRIHIYPTGPGVRVQTGRYLPSPGAKVRQIDPFPVKTDYTPTASLSIDPPTSHCVHGLLYLGREERRAWPSRTSQSCLPSPRPRALIPGIRGARSDVYNRYTIDVKRATLMDVCKRPW